MDEDEQELIRRRLTDDVRETVQKQLFRTYAMTGTAVIAVLGYANWNIFEDTKAQVVENADAAVQDAVADAQEKIAELKVSVAAQTGRIEYERERAVKVHSQVADQLAKLDLEASNLTTLNESVAALVDARRQLETDLEDIKARTEKLSVLGAELKRISEQLRVSDQANAQTYGDVIDKLDNAEKNAQVLAKRPTVYLQFAGGARSKAVELSEKLRVDGFVMPGEERHAGAAGKREIRYYYEADLEGANALASATLTAMTGMGYADDEPFTINDLTGYRGTKPKPGIIELWVEL